MRWIALLAISVLGCGRQRESKQYPVAVVRAGSAVPADAGTALVELLHAVPSTIRVSSRVANNSILPAHIADGNLQTAWNSRTGELGGAWVDVDVPDAQIHELRLTVGHTGKGNVGEDYFAMNWRIHKVSLWINGKQVATQLLDTERRDLQTVALPAPASHVRLQIETLVPGTKKNWREAAISELEAWGTAAAATPGKRAPTVAVGEPAANANGPLDPDHYCDDFLKPAMERFNQSVEYDRAHSEKCHAEHPDAPSYDPECDNPDPPGMPECSMTLEKHVTGGPWRGAGVMSSTTDNYYSSTAIQAFVAAKDGVWPIGEEQDCGGHFSATPGCVIEVRGARVLASGELEVKVHVTAGSHGDQDLTYVCTYGPPVTCNL